MKRIYAINTRLSLTNELKNYLESYIKDYNIIQRRIFYDLKNDVVSGFSSISKYISYICNTYNILKHTANSIRYDMQGRIKAYYELKKTELKQLEIKIQALYQKIQNMESVIIVLKPLVCMNQATDKQLQEYRNIKKLLYYQKNKRNKLIQKQDNLKKHIKDKKISLCFGSKDMFDKQLHLQENGYNSHEKWNHDFEKNRNI